MSENLTSQIRKWIDFACDSNGVPELKYKIKFQFESSFTRRMGDAMWDRKKKQGIVRLSSPLWPRASEQERYETVVHEACHVVVGYKNENRRVQPHGEEWKRAMLACEIQPNRTHCVDRKGLARNKKRMIVSDCGNPEVANKCRVTSVQLNQLKCGTTLHCKVCRLNIDFHGLEEDDYE